MNWEQLLQDYHIDYVTRGPNTRKGEISVRCPWCGEDDPSHHMGVALTKEAWGCHRNALHRGKRPHRLIKALLGCSQGQASIVLAQYSQADPETLDQALQALEIDTGAQFPATDVDLEPLWAEFVNIDEQPGTKRFWGYLHKRGFNDPTSLSFLYNLRCTTTGRWKDRILIPIYQNRKLIAWTGRAIQKPVSAPRYLSTSSKIKTTVYNEDMLRHFKNELLLVAEGPFDALKLDYYGANYGAVATCLFGTSITIDQMSILKEVSGRYKHTVLLLDQDAIEASFLVSDWLPNAVIATLPAGVKDPGDLSEQQIGNLIKEYL